MKEKPEPRKEIKLTPEEVILHTFEFKKTNMLSLDDIWMLVQGAGCPSREVAEGVLARLVEQGVLKWERKEGRLLFFLPKPEQEKTN